MSDRGHLPSSGRTVVFFYLDMSVSPRGDGPGDDGADDHADNDDDAGDDPGLPDSEHDPQCDNEPSQVPHNDDSDYSVDKVYDQVPYKRPRTHRLLYSIDDYAELKACGVEDVECETQLSTSLLPLMPSFSKIVLGSGLFAGALDGIPKRFCFSDAVEYVLATFECDGVWCPVSPR